MKICVTRPQCVKTDNIWNYHLEEWKQRTHKVGKGISWGYLLILYTSEWHPECHGYHCYCVMCDVHTETEERAEYWACLPWVPGVFCVTYTLKHKTIQQEAHNTTQQKQMAALGQIRLMHFPLLNREISDKRSCGVMCEYYGSMSYNGLVCVFCMR